MATFLLKYKQLTIFCGLFLLNLVIYWNSLGAFFVSDDFDWLNIAANSSTVFKSFVGNYYGLSGVGGSFRPLVAVLFYLERLFFGLQPLGYHLVSVLLNSLVAWLIYKIIKKLFDKNNTALAAAILFSILPNHVEAVSWIAAVADPLATSLYLASFYVYISGPSKLKQPFLSLFWFILALLTKESAVTLPVILVVYEILLAQEKFKLVVLKKVWPYFILLFSYVAYRLWATGILFGYYGRATFISGLQIKDYLKTFINIGASMVSVGQLRIALAQFIITHRLIASALVVIILLGWYFKTNLAQKQRWGFWFLFWLVNVLLVMPLRLGVINDEGQRFGYTASITVAIVLASLLSYVYKHHKKFSYILASSLIFYFGLFGQTLINQWVTSATISKKIFEQIKSFDFKTPQKTYIIGLPDAYLNAQLYRNGFVPSLALQNMVVADNKIERIPVYVYLNDKNRGQELYSSQVRNSDGFLWTSKNNDDLITGNATETHPDYVFELWGYDYGSATSSQVKLMFKKKALENFKQNQIQLLYFNQGGLKRWAP